MRCPSVAAFCTKVEEPKKAVKKAKAASKNTGFVYVSVSQLMSSITPNSTHIFVVAPYELT